MVVAVYFGDEYVHSWRMIRCRLVHLVKSGVNHNFHAKIPTSPCLRFLQVKLVAALLPSWLQGNGPISADAKVLGANYQCNSSHCGPLLNHNYRGESVH
jgi:hypothetical protein